ncbi:hypothetical protein Lfu02_15940 [Longispora fulva]|uniref:Protein-glutamine gamma-glutamyltransferase-like C-terminal domain-containing protein n=1 Tax=Longispora fulva TaxID=619741 RepID=A0A8J7KT69_9ACTN|nr:DUF4129 domain-containing protein [Longispora fulva]MBG6140397.1 hypothetical protein [Longispora fulva]GIG57222.1 hypothetical protein Lfu02_15940 [Longispora fulva]
MARWWTALVADVADWFPGGVAGLMAALLLGALFLIAALRWWRQWLAAARRALAAALRLGSWLVAAPGRLHRWLLRLLAWRPGRRRPKPAKVTKTITIDDLPEGPDDALPELPAEVLLSLADQYAAAGRYGEAVRERLRVMIRRLADRGVLSPQPGSTVTELAMAAGAALPTADAPLREATRIFSDIWYGERPATAEMDARMRTLGESL